jgi:hypothetical protein
LWTYLNTPFLYTHDGFTTEEISPIQVEGEIWRRLKVTFPDHVKSHTKVQISCFGPDGLLRRHDYTVDILGGATSGVQRRVAPRAANYDRRSSRRSNYGGSLSGPVAITTILDELPPVFLARVSIC